MPLPTIIQTSPDLERDRRLAEALYRRRVPVRDVGSGISNAVNAIVGGIQIKQANEAIEEDRQAQNRALAEALRAGKPWRNPDTAPATGIDPAEQAPDGRRYMKPGEVAEGTGGMDAVIASLAKNPRMSGAANTFRMNKLIAEDLARRKAAAAEQFETVQSPFNRGGVGQRSTTSGKVVNYQPPEKEEGPQSPLGKLVTDLRAGRVTEEQFNNEVAEKVGDSEFERLLARAPKAQRQALLESRLAKMATQSGWQVETSPDGGVRITQGPMNKMPSGNKQDEIQEGLDAFGRAREAISGIRSAISSDEGRAGFAGTLRRSAQTGASILADLAKQIPGVGEFMDSTLTEMTQEIGPFDERMSQFPVEESVLAYALARARKPSGRIAVPDVEAARQDVKLQGLTSVKDVLARLDVIDREFAKAQADYSKRLGRGAPPGTNAPAVGTVEDGYRFKGGDPADKNNWEQIEGGDGAAQQGGGDRADMLDGAGPTQMQMGQARLNHIAARGDSARAKPPANRTAEDWRDIANFLQILGAPSDAWQAEEQRLRQFQGGR